MKLKDYLESLTTDCVVDLRSDNKIDCGPTVMDKNRICLCSTDSEGITPYLEREVVSWGIPAYSEERNLWIALKFILKREDAAV